MGVSDKSAAKTQCSTAEASTRIWHVETPARLEIFLQNCMPDASRQSLRRALAAGACQVDGVARPWGYRLTAGMVVSLDAEARISEVVPEDIPVEILYEDDDLIAVNKPSGMLVHPTSQVRIGTMANALRGAGYREVHFLHRLDRDTSGVLVAAKQLHRGSPLVRMFPEREVAKRYLAMTAGPVPWTERTVELPIGRDPARMPQWNVSDGGAASETRFRLLHRSAAGDLLEAVPVTGRTNQIRIHSAAIGHPLLGDTAYGGPPAGRLFLHAWTLEIPAPPDGRRLFVAPIPPGFPPPTAWAC